ncbi:MAG: aminopeptidase P family N-terminal domain-containing protein, partial [Nitrososphaerota archaeon]|nr:aminopeptidase P family N-terminal domain-containing protein [Nitrososphaerota archaeon]
MAASGVYRRRLHRLAKALERFGLEGVVIVPGPNLTYLTGVRSLLLERPFMLLVPASGVPSLVAPAFEAGPYERCGATMKISKWTDSEGSGGAIEEAVRSSGAKDRWGAEGR